jgi:hypothetical protein
MVKCANCGHTFGAIIETILDAGRDPDAKVRLLGGAVNAAQCPACGYQMAVGTPLLYHDPAKDLLIGFVPMELNMNNDQQEKVLGDLLRELTQSIPQNQFRGYLFQPRRALSLQHLVEQILQADGITPEMIDAQKVRARLIELLVGASPDALPALVRENDAQIDEVLFHTMTLMAQRLAAGGSSDAAERIMQVQAEMARHSTYGQAILREAADEEAAVQQVTTALHALDEDADRPEFLELARGYADSPIHLRALVSLARPAFDEGFFNEMTAAIGAAPADERAALEGLRDDLLSLTHAADEQAQNALRAAASLLQQIINTPDIDGAVAQSAGMIDTTFMSVLEANLQQAQRGGDQVLFERLLRVYNRVNAMIEDNMPPALRFLNDLLTTPTDEDAILLLNERAADYAADLLPTMEAVERILAQQGENALLTKLVFLRARAEQLLRA